MPLIYLETVINAPQPLVFDISRNVDVHKSSMVHHNEEIIDGITTGLMNTGDTVTWKAAHLFRTRTLKVRISDMKPPHFFCDEMITGDFKKMKHEHYFNPLNGGTLMIDRFYFSSPFGIIGKIADTLFLKNYMAGLLKKRNEEIKRVAESDQTAFY